MDTLKVALLYRGVLYVEVILYSKECNWYTRCCLLNGGVTILDGFVQIQHNMIVSWPQTMRLSVTGYLI